MKKSVVITLISVGAAIMLLGAAAVVVVIGMQKGWFSKQKAAQVPIENRALTVRTLAPIAVFGSFNYDAGNINDNNLNTCWSINLTRAAQQGAYHGNVLDGLEFTLESPEIGSVVIWNGFTKTTELYAQNAAATYVVLIDASNNTVLKQCELADRYGPSVISVGKRLSKCPDGKYKVMLNFGSAGNQGVRRGYRYDDFCVSEVHFWSTPNPKIQWPVGNRAAYDLKGPVRIFTNYDGTTRFFTQEGFENSGRTTYYTDHMVISSYSNGDSITETYNSSGYLSHKLRNNIETFDYYYDYEGNLTSLPYNKKSGRGEYIQTFVNNNKATAEHWKYNGYDRYLAESWTFDILEVDKYNNWTSRRVVETGEIQTRTLLYYYEDEF